MFGGKWFVLAFALFTLATPLAAPQADPEIPYDIYVANLTAPEPIVVDRANPIEALVVNDAGTARSIRVTVEAVQVATGASRTLYDQAIVFEEQERQEFAVDWNGRATSGFAASGDIAIVARAIPSDGAPDRDLQNNEQTIARTLREVAFRVTLPEPSSESLEPGATWRMAGELRNEGTHREDVRIAAAPVVGDWMFTTVPSQVFLDPGASHEVTIEAVVPNTAPANERGQGTLQVHPADLSGPDHTEAVSFETAPIAPGGLLAASFATHATATVDSTLELPMTVTNHRNQHQTVRILAQGTATGTGISSLTAGPLELPIGASQPAVLPFDIAASAPAGESQWTILLETPVQTFEAGTVVIDVQPDHKVTLQFTGPAPNNVVPGEPVVLGIRIENEGNIVESNPTGRFTILEGGWSVDADPVVDLQPGQDADVDVKIIVPSTAPAGPNSARLAWAIEDHVAGQLSWTPNVAASGYPTVAAPALLPMSAGQNLRASVTVTNTGNSDDRMFFESRVADTSSRPASTWSLTDTASSEGHLLARGLSKTFHVQAVAPSDLTNADQLHVILDVTTASGAASPPVEITWAANVPNHDLSLGPTSPNTLYAGYEGTLDLIVRNAGAAGAPPTTLEVSFTGADGKVVSASSLEIPAIGANGRYVATINVPTGAGDLRLDARVVPVTGDPALANNELDAQIQILDLRIEIRRPVDQTIRPGQAVGLDGLNGFTVRNLGDDIEQLSAHLTASVPWFPQQQEELLLRPGERAQIPAIFTVPALPLAETVNVTLTVTRDVAPVATFSATTMLRVPDTSGPSIRDLQANPSSVAVATPMTLRAIVEDVAGVRAVQAAIVRPEGTVDVVPMTRQGSHYAAQYTPDLAGIHRWSVQASDLTLATHRSESPAQSFRVTDELVPRITLLEPGETSRIGPLQVLEWGIAHGRSLQSVTATVGAQEIALDPAGPFQLDAWTLPDGTAKVTLNVTDVLGATARHVSSIQIDSEPPRLVTISGHPVAPTVGASQQVNVTLDDAGIVQEARLRFVDQQGQGRDVPLELVDGMWQATLPWPRDVVRILVIATDDLGNEGAHRARWPASEAADPALAEEASAPGFALLAFGCLLLARRFA
ncbi:MAG: hypothetical protein ACPHID_02400 [Thermoplasmatota archaeon]